MILRNTLDFSTSEFVRRVIGVPWANRACSFERVDCWGLVILYYRHVLGIELHQTPDYEAGEDFFTCYQGDVVFWRQIDNPVGIEAWQGVHVYANASTASVALSWTQDYLLLNTTGKHGPFQAMATLTGGAELFTLPSTDNSYFYCLNTARLKVSNMTGDMSASSFNSTYLVTVDANAGVLFENTSIYFGSNLRIAPSNWSSIDLVNDRFLKFILAPSGYEYEGKGISYATTYSTQAINGGDGRVQLAPPVGWKIIGVEAWVIIGTQGQATSVAPIGIVSFSDTAVNLQTPVNTANTFSINYKLRLKVNK